MKEIILEGAPFYEKRKQLTKVRTDNVNWLVYYTDIKTGEKWVEEYPQAELHGGGPPQLLLLAKFPWE